MATNLIEISKKYNTQAKCLDYMTKLRWGECVKCTCCESEDVRIVKNYAGRYLCKSCKKQFSVFTDTIFEGTRLLLPKWFLIIGSILNAKSGKSAMEINRDYGGSYKTSYYVGMRVRIGMLVEDTKLNGIIEMDDGYFGGKARKQKRMPDNDANLASITLKRGRGTNKVSVAGIVERQGDVKTQVMEKLTKRNLLSMLKHYASKENSILVTDGFRSYKELEKYIDRLEINHSKEFSKGIVHVNTNEGFWSYIKNGIKGSYKAISKKYLPFYLVEYEWKFNHRNFKGNEFETFLINALANNKELLYWKAKDTKKVKEIVYGN